MRANPRGQNPVFVCRVDGFHGETLPDLSEALTIKCDIIRGIGYPTHNNNHAYLWFKDHSGLTAARALDNLLWRPFRAREDDASGVYKRDTFAEGQTNIQIAVRQVVCRPGTPTLPDSDTTKVYLDGLMKAIQFDSDRVRMVMDTAVSTSNRRGPSASSSIPTICATTASCACS